MVTGAAWLFASISDSHAADAMVKSKPQKLRAGDDPARRDSKRKPCLVLINVSDRAAGLSSIVMHLVGANRSRSIDRGHKDTAGAVHVTIRRVVGDLAAGDIDGPARGGNSVVTICERITSRAYDGAGTRLNAIIDGVHYLRVRDRYRNFSARGLNEDSISLAVGAASRGASTDVFDHGIDNVHGCGRAQRDVNSTGAKAKDIDILDVQRFARKEADTSQPRAAGAVRRGRRGTQKPIEPEIANDHCVA